MKLRHFPGIAAAVVLLLVSLSCRAEEETDPAALAKLLPQASVPLDQGLKASEREGLPISAKFEIEHGALQLSIYTMKGARFSEVIVDHTSAAIKKSEPVTDSDDMEAALKQSAAMAKAKISLAAAVGSAVGANAGYRAVGVEPMLDGGRPVAAVILMKGEEVKKTTEKLD
jgi:hypothetical protein